MQKNINLNFQKSRYTEFPAAIDLKHIVGFFWSFKVIPAEKKTFEFSFVPTHQSSLIIIKKDKKIADVFFNGPSFKKKKFRSDSDVLVIGVNLTSFAAIRFFGLDYSRLIYGSIQLKEVLKNKEYFLFKKSIDNCISENDFIIKISDFLRARSGINITIDKDVEKLCRMIISTDGEKRFEEYYSDLQVNKRNLQRKFKNTLGFSPKEFSRLVRIQHACSELVASGFKHFDVMYRYGYYDQSHYIKEFRKIMGSSPKDFESSQRKIVYKLIEK